MKKIVSVLLCIVMCISFVTVTVSADDDTIFFLEEEMATELRDLGLFKGVSDTDFALWRAPTRVESVVMLIRSLGREKEALSLNLSHPFYDVPKWADAYIGYAYQMKLTNGVSENRFGTGSSNAAMYLTFMLRALGYSDANNADFSWNDPFRLAGDAGILPMNVSLSEFYRADVVTVSYAALNAKLKDSEQTLADNLISDGVFSSDEYDSCYDGCKLDGFFENGFSHRDDSINGQNSYYYNQLSEASKKLYDGIYSALDRDELDLWLWVTPEELAGMTEETALRMALDAVRYDNPKLFWFNRGCTYRYYSSNDGYILHIFLTCEEYWTGGENGEKMRRELEETVGYYADIARNTGSTRYSQLKAVHDIVVERLDYDYRSLSIVNGDGEIGDSELIYSAYGALVFSRAVCFAYAESMKIILDELGIPCQMVVSEEHAWNIVWLDGTPTYIDACWDDASAILEDGTRRPDSEKKYDYFGLTTDEITQVDMHIPDTSMFTYPECVSKIYNYYVREGLYLEEYDQDAMSAIIDYQYDLGMRVFTVRMGSYDALKTAEYELITNEHIWELAHIGGHITYLFDDKSLVVRIEPVG